ncbi:MAG: hypothetical protein AB1Z81_15675 [Desulfotignum sp.]
MGERADHHLITTKAIPFICCTTEPPPEAACRHQTSLFSHPSFVTS